MIHGICTVPVCVTYILRSNSTQPFTTTNNTSLIREKSFEMFAKSGCTDLRHQVTRGPNSILLHLMFVGSQSGICFLSPYWNPEFWSCSLIFGKSVYPSVKSPLLTASLPTYHLVPFCMIQDNVLCFPLVPFHVISSACMYSVGRILLLPYTGQMTWLLETVCASILECQLPVTTDGETKCYMICRN
jgi:hypothetical protein